MSSPLDADPTASFKKTFFEECAELLNAAEGHLADLDAGRANADTLHAVFRAVHSIKGGAGAFGFAQLVRFAHALEALLDDLRAGSSGPSREVVALLLRAIDVLGDIVAAAQNATELTDGNAESVLAVLEESRRAQDGTNSHHAPATAPRGAVETYEIGFTPGQDLLRRAHEPLLLVRALQRLGTLAVEVDATHVPDLALLDPEICHLAWNFRLETDAGEDAVREVFEFVEDLCELSICSKSSGPGAACNAAPGPTLPAVAPGATARPNSAVTSIRVDTDKVDRLVNLVGELVITQAMLAQQGGYLPVEQYPALIQGLEALSQHARELQESVMAIRAQPVKSVFVRMPRLVRELATSLGKEVRLLTSGETTEIDKTVIEQLTDPLTHMIRNAIDHGIESPDERVRRGKPPEGTIYLSAEHRSGRIVIEIADDGRGLNRERVLAKARERELVPADAALSEEEIDNLIFLPGFSTAEQVSNVSGRGVGMDVVKRNIQALGGRITIESKAGAGSRFLLSLPLTLAVLDGMVVAVGRETYIIPLTNIMESLRPKPADIHPVVGKGAVLSIRGEYVPLVYPSRIFKVPDTIADPCAGTVVIVENEGEGRIGLVVDELLGQQQVVIKSLESNFRSVEGISGATILGNGRVALILDVARLRNVDRPRPTRRAEAAGDTAALSPTLH